MYLVFDVGGTFIKYAWMTKDGDILEKSKIKTPVAFDNTVDDFIETIRQVYLKYKEKGEVEGIAMDLPGQVDVKRGFVYLGGSVHYIRHMFIADMVSNACDGVRVTLENDAKAAALAEVWLGNAKGMKDAVVMVLGTGVGGGVIIDGKVHHGFGMLAGEFSYIPAHIDRARVDSLVCMDQFKTVEEVMMHNIPVASDYMSLSALCYRASVIKGVPRSEISGELIYKWAAEGDREMNGLLEDMYFEIAKMCLSLYLVVNPEVILLGGGISSNPLFVEGVSKYIEKLKVLSHIFDDIKIDTCKFNNDSNLYGALYNFMQIYNAV